MTTDKMIKYVIAVDYVAYSPRENRANILYTYLAAPRFAVSGDVKTELVPILVKDADARQLNSLLENILIAHLTRENETKKPL